MTVSFSPALRFNSVPSVRFEAHERGLIVQEQGRLFLRHPDVLSQIVVEGQRVFVGISERLYGFVLGDADDDRPNLSAVDHTVSP